MVSNIYIEPMRMFTTLPIFLGLVILLYLSSAFARRVEAQNMIRCIEKERQALLNFKQSLVDDYGILSSWGSDVHQRECCNWWGVHCDNNTDHVTILDLHAPIHEECLRGQKVSPSLLELRHLNYLDLSYNDFQGSHIPKFIGSFQRLQVLSLMDANFSSTIPPQLGNLTNLKFLKITGFNNLKIKNLEWLSLLSSLRHIDLSHVHIDLIEFPKTIVSLSPSLEVLKLPHCELLGTLPFSLNSSCPFLSIVDLSYNNLTSSSVLHFLRNASKQLTSIYLSGNNFVGSIPDAFGDMKFLENLNLNGNFFTDRIPKSFGNLTHLQILSLYSNQLNESIAELFEKLLEGAGKSLQILDLSGNKIRGSFQSIKGFGQECDLLSLDLSDNQITGQFPNLSHFSSLRVLDLSGNQLQGGLPETIGKLSKLEVLYASSNSLEGVVTKAHFSNLTDIRQLDLSNNAALSFNLSVGWIPSFQLSILILANCKMGPQFPKWLQTQSTMISLDISFGDISDTIPNWFWNLSTNFKYLNLSNNKIGGRLPDLSTNFSPFSSIDLSSNDFWGLVPLLPQNISVLHLSNNKFVGSIAFLCSIINPFTISIDLSDNQFSGEIPDCWNNSIGLLILNLGNNYFSGKVPYSLGSLFQLQSLHLRNNCFTGKLPSSLQNCTSLSVVDFGENKFTGRIPSWIGGSLTNLVIVSLRHNEFYGNIPSRICHLDSIQILDLSGNNLTGHIPWCINNFTYLMHNNRSIEIPILRVLLVSKSGDYGGYIDNILIQWKNKEWEYRKQLGLLKSIDLSSNQLIGDIPEGFSSLKGLISLNLSKNHLTRKIFPTIYHMENLESLDLSQNQLSGEIPTGLARLNYLAVLNLSNNFLSGKIPTGTQLQSFNASSYAGNSELCGDPLPKCPKDVPRHSKNNDYQEGDSFVDRGFYIAMVLGFSLSFWGIVVTLVLKDSWRSTYYGFLNNVKDWHYMKMKIYLVKLQRKFRITG